MGYIGPVGYDRKLRGAVRALAAYWACPEEHVAATAILEAYARLVEELDAFDGKAPKTAQETVRDRWPDIRPVSIRVEIPGMRKRIYHILQRTDGLYSPPTMGRKYLWDQALRLKEPDSTKTPYPLSDYWLTEDQVDQEIRRLIALVPTAPLRLDARPWSRITQDIFKI